VKNIDWVQNPIDTFVLEQLEKQGLSPAAPAGRLMLLRRAYFDLTGLPPPPDVIDQFIQDDRPEAYAELIDRLLASPQYGERWGRYWLDLVRYADTGGFENDFFYPRAWRYRDYVIRSINANKPFDRFIEEQVAGDELWPKDADAVLATGMYCIGPVGESAMMSTQLEYEWLTDAADTTGAAFLGMTFGCARCHDHKYDPITQQDYFGVQAIFAASDRPYPPKVRLQRIKALNDLLSDAPVPKKYENDPRCTLIADTKMGLQLFHREQPLTVHRLRRGELSKPKEEIGPAIPTALAGREETSAFQGAAAGQRRAILAKWLLSPKNPLTARVLVNRVWAWHFGQGIVRTPSDFGLQGEPPTNPELLDWLAAEFISHGWNLKQLHRTIMLSSTYRMQSCAEGRGLVIDPEDRLLWHFPRHRLEGEAIRDSMLACAGVLSLKEFGAPVVPPLGKQELTGLFDARDKWPVSRSAAEYTRRSVYLLVRRTFVYPMFSAFDPPETMVSCSRRIQTIVPTQALTLLNSPLAREDSRAFARRLIHECGTNPERLVRRAWILAFGRPVNPAEASRTMRFLNGDVSEERVADLCLAIFNANEFIYVD
jgi:hypothetical protein